MAYIMHKRRISEHKVYVVKEIHAPHFDPTFHSHPEYQLNYVVTGEGSRFIGNNITSFGAGDMVLIGQDLPHVWRSETKFFEKESQLDTHVIVIYFHADFLGTALGLKDEMTQINTLLKKSERGLEVVGETNIIVRELMYNLMHLEGMDGVIQLIKILNVLAKSHDCTFVTHNYLNTLIAEEDTNRLNKVYSYVMKNYHNTVSVTEVAALVNMTRTSFSRYFRSHVNKSFSDFLKEIRIESACTLLKDGKMNIDQIGYESGFQTLSNFNKQFKMVTGKQPHLYRNEFLKVATFPYQY